MNINKSWKTIETKTIYSTPWCSVFEEIVELPNGVIINDYSVVELRDVAMIFPITKNNEVIFAKQYRHGVKKILIELPAGTYDKNKEQSEDAAVRELREETGYRAKEIISIGTVYDYPTKDRHSIDIYLSKDVVYDPLEYKDNTEDVDVLKIPLSEIDDYISRGEIAVGSTISAIYLAKNWLLEH